MTKPKVLFVGSFKEQAKDGSVGGQMFACRSLINGPLKNEVDFICLDTTAESVPAPPVHIRAIGALKRLWQFLLILQKEEDISSVLIFTSAGFSFLEKGLMSIWAKFKNKKVILAPRSGILLDNFNKSKFFRWYIPFVIKKVDVVICQGETWKTFYQQCSQQPSSMFKVIKNWIDVTPYLDVKHSSNATIRILYMGWLEEYKGINDLIVAFESYVLKNKEVDVVLHIAGKGSLENSVLDLIDKNEIGDKIKFHGWAKGDDKLKLFSQADIFVLPSHREGMPNVLIEAMASGIAVIATEVGGVPDMIVNMENGISIPASNPNQIEESISYLIDHSDFRIQMAKKGQQYILKEHAVEGVSSIFLDTFKSNV
jgi:glycosyltransferase involved in cell wall biosynthesis